LPRIVDVEAEAIAERERLPCMTGPTSAIASWKVGSGALRVGSALLMFIVGSARSTSIRFRGSM
jgi:hypothetical protein